MVRGKENGSSGNSVPEGSVVKKAIDFGPKGQPFAQPTGTALGNRCHPD
jgi:hypothetical protein